MIDDSLSQPSYPVSDGLPGNQRLTALELAQVNNMREMVKQLVCARECRLRGDIDCYHDACARAGELVNEIKCEVDELFRIYQAELLGGS